MALNTMSEKKGREESRIEEEKKGKHYFRKTVLLSFSHVFLKRRFIFPV